MLSEALRRAIRSNLLHAEREEDLSTLVELLADARAEARGRPRQAKDEQFAGTILCPIFDPVKVEAYQESINELRRKFAGIATNGELKRIFRASVSPELLGGNSGQLFDG